MNSVAVLTCETTIEEFEGKEISFSFIELKLKCLIELIDEIKDNIDKKNLKL